MHICLYLTAPGNSIRAPIYQPTLCSHNLDDLWHLCELGAVVRGHFLAHSICDKLVRDFGRMVTFCELRRALSFLVFGKEKSHSLEKLDCKLTPARP